MSWLPCIKHGSDRWWLPLSRQAADVLAATMVVGTESPRHLAAIVQQLRVDPPLLIFAALATKLGSVAPPPAVTLPQLGEALRSELSSLLIGGDSSLGAPVEGDSTQACSEREALTARWFHLQQRFLELPRSQWLPAAADWLELTGPPVPALWRQAWPTITSDSATAVAADSAPDAAAISYSPSQLDLAALARTVCRGQDLEQRFLDTLREAKRAALKEFAYGLSHEINNPLANISTRAQTLLRDEADAHRSKSLQRIIDQTMRAHEMVADLMFYAHPPTPQASAVDVHDVLRTVVNQSLDSVEGRCIELVISPSAESITLVADRGMLIEAVRSLVRNAIEAIGCDGRVQLACQARRASSIAPPLDQAAAAVITICDSGPGLSDAARVHAFDPYFSGREAGRGLGVGLCRVERIAKLHGGGVSLHSGPAGCTARLWIPLRT